ncbi:MAG: hypothetical protein ACJ8DU_06655 [Microvirga sp.]|jgi:hypothetical protein
MRWLTAALAAALATLAGPALAALGAELPDEAGQTPAALGELVRSEIEKWVPVIKKAGVTAN